MKKQKVVLYCRSKTQEQLMIQRNQLLQVALENNWEVISVIMEKRKGTYRRRFKFRLAMILAQRHEAAILVGDISRLSRDTFVAVEYAKQLKARDIKLVSAKDDAKTDQVYSILQFRKMTSLLASV